MESQTWKVGELAKQTGLTVRTLRFYEEIGLLPPTKRTEAGHRLYDEGDLLRLQRIQSLRQLGFSLDEIQACLDKPEFAIAPLIELHLSRLTEQIASYQRLHERLTRLHMRLQTEDVIPPGHLLEALEAMTVLDTYMTPEQIKTVEQQHAKDAEEGRYAIRQQWQALFQALTTHVEAGDDPASAAVQALADRWRALIHESTGGDPELAKAAARLYQEQPEARRRAGMSDAVWDYANKALAVSPGQRSGG